MWKVMTQSMVYIEAIQWIKFVKYNNKLYKICNDDSLKILSIIMNIIQAYNGGFR